MAAFLIGDEIEVVTRYIKDNDGYKFVTRLDMEAINVEQDSLPVGTSIIIRVNSECYHSLISVHQKKLIPNRFNWYQLDEPTVLRRWHNIDGSIGSKNNVGKINFKKESQWWYKLDVPYSYKVYWTLNDAPALTCNGLFISNSASLRSVPLEVSGNKDAPIQYPLVSVLDGNAEFPLNLERNDIRTDGYPFGVLLIRDVMQEMLAWLMFNGPDYLESPDVKDTHLPWLTSGESNGALVTSSRGFALRLAALLDGMPIRYAINYQREGIIVQHAPEDSIIFAASKVLESSAYNTSMLKLSVVSGPDLDVKVAPLYREILHNETFIDKRAPRNDVETGSYYGREGGPFKIEKQNKGWLIASQHDCPKTEIEIYYWPKVAASKYNKKKAYITETFFPEGSYLKAVSKPWLLDELWLEYFGKNWIPFNLKERIAKFPDTAKFFAERYPQVVPDEAWPLLGGKPV